MILRLLIVMFLLSACSQEKIAAVPVVAPVVAPAPVVEVVEAPFVEAPIEPFVEAPVVRTKRNHRKAVVPATATISPAPIVLADSAHDPAPASPAPATDPAPADPAPADPAPADPAPASAVFKKHTIGLLIGHDNIAFFEKMVEKNGLIYGAQYAYHLDNAWSLSGMATSNDSILAGAGYSFANAHTISLLIGHAKQNYLEVIKNKGLIYGAQYAYHLDDVWSLSGMAASDKSILAGAGYSFDL